MTNPLTWLALTAVLWFNRKAKRLAIHLVKWTGKSRELVHPKHLLANEDYWYLAYCKPGDMVLDVGCGHGAHTLRVAEKIAPVGWGMREGKPGWILGVDRDRESVSVARCQPRRLLPIYFAAADFEQADWTNVLVAGDTFTVILCLDVLEHLHRRAGLLADLRRLLKPDGVLLLAVPNRETAWKKRLAKAGCFAYSDPDHKVEYTLLELNDELKRVGFVITRLHPCVVDTPLIGLIDIIGGLSLRWYAALTRWRYERAIKHPDDAAGYYAVCKIAAL